MTLEEKIEQNLRQLHTEIENRMKITDKKFQQELYQKCMNILNEKEQAIRKMLEIPLPIVDKEIDVLLDRAPKDKEETKNKLSLVEITFATFAGLSESIIGFLLVFLGLFNLEKPDHTNLVDPEIQNYFDQETDTTLLVNKVFEAIEQNDQITEEELFVFEQLRDYFEDNTYMDYCDVYQILANLDITYLSEQPIDDGNTFVLAEYYASVPEIKVYRMGWNVKSEILPHEYVHITGRLFDYPELSEGITELIAREYYTNGKLLDYYPKNTICIRLLCELIDPQIILEAYSTHNSNLIVEALAANFPTDNLSYFAKCLLDQMENYCASIQNDDFEYCKNNLKSIITFYIKVCGMEELSPYFEQYMTYLINFYTVVPNENENIRLYFNSDTVQLEKEQSQKILKNEELYYI